MFAILAQAAALEREGRPIIHLEIGDTSGIPNPELQALLGEPDAFTSLGYSPSAGEPDLRAVLAETYTWEKQHPFEPAHVAVTPANAAIAQLLGVLCDPGDRVLLPDPSFPTFRLAIDFNGLVPVYFPLVEARGWRPDVGAIATRVRNDRRIRALIIDSPSNPLGIAHSPALLEEIAELCRRHRVACIFDDTYKNLVYAPGHRPVRHREGSFYIYSFSKEAAAPALRSGCVVGDARVIGALADYSSLFFSCQPKPFQRIVAAYLGRPRRFLETMRALLPGRIAATACALRRSPWLDFVEPNAGLYVYVNVRRLGLPAGVFAETLLRARGVCVCPGEGFGPSGADYVRLSLAGDGETLARGCELLTDFAAELGALGPATAAAGAGRRAGLGA